MAPVFQFLALLPALAALPAVVASHAPVVEAALNDDDQCGAGSAQRCALRALQLSQAPLPTSDAGDVSVSDTGDVPASNTGDDSASDTGDEPASDTDDDSASDTDDDSASDTDDDSDSDADEESQSEVLLAMSLNTVRSTAENITMSEHDSAMHKETFDNTSEDFASEPERAELKVNPACTKGYVGMARKAAPECIDACSDACGAMSKVIKSFTTKGGQPAAMRAACRQRSQFSCFVKVQDKCQPIFKEAAKYGMRIPKTYEEFISKCR